MKNTESSITFNKEGVAVGFIGPDAVNCYAAGILAMSLRLYADTKMLPTKGVTAKNLLESATRITKKTYKRGDYLKASNDVSLWLTEMRDALPHEFV